MAHADRANRRVGRFVPGIIVARAEHLGLRAHLRVHFEADDHVELNGHTDRYRAADEEVLSIADGPMITSS